MHTMRKVALAAFAALLLLSLMAGTAAALRSISVNEKSVHVIFERLQFTDANSELGITCRVTLRRVFNSNTFAKTEREVGNTVEIRLEGCRDTLGVGVTVVPLIEARAPWILLYNGFTGTLPNITGIKFIIRRTKFLIRDDNIFRRFACLYEGDAAGEAVVARETGAITAVRADPTRTIPAIITLSGSCPTAGKFSGEGTVVRLRDLAGGVVVKLI